MTVTFNYLKVLKVTSVTLISTTLSRDTADTVVATAPSGILDGDLIVAVCVRNQTGFSIPTPPSGFTQVLDHDTTTNSFVILKKTASSESGNYSITWSAGAGQQSVIHMMLFRQATTIDTIGTPSYQSGNTGQATSISPTQNGMLVGVFVRQDANALVFSDPAGMTLIQANTGSNPEIVSYYVSNNPSGATGTKTINWDDATADDCSQFLMQIA